MRASPTGEIVFSDVRIPKANLVGTEGEYFLVGFRSLGSWRMSTLLAGDAVLHMMRNLECERLGLAAMSLGIARRSIEVSIQNL